MIKRNRKVNPIALFWTLVLGIGYGEHRSIASLRRAYEEATGTTLASSSFYDRFTPKLVEFLKRACQRALDQVVCEGENVLQDGSLPGYRHGRVYCFAAHDVSGFNRPYSFPNYNLH